MSWFSVKILPPTPPLPGTLWRHKRGDIYIVRFCTNNGGEKKPVDVVYYTQGYENDPTKQWSRRLTDWHRSFTPIAE